MRIKDEQGWHGSKSSERGSLKDLAKRLREYIKSESDLNRFKFSVVVEHYSTIMVSIMSGPMYPFKDGIEARKDQLYDQHPESHCVPEIVDVCNKINDWLDDFNYDHSNIMTDYFDRGFYHYVYLGKYGKPYEVQEVKRVEVKSGSLQYVDYSEKAFAIVGETKAICGQLKELGGRFNGRLKCGAGWIFSKSREDRVRAALGL